MKHNKLIVATRLHTSNEAIPIDTEKLQEWCAHVLGYCDELILVVDHRYFETLKGMFTVFGERLKVFHIHPWISFTQPLNMIVEKALSVDATRLLFQSIEVTLEKEDIAKLLEHLDDKTLVVGAKLHPKHGAKKGKQPLDGWNSPWNTLALWDLQKLGLTGFLTISSGNIDHIPGGVEEVVAISLLQYLRPDCMEAKLIDLPTVHWDATWECALRTKYHESKMASKAERAYRQIQELHIKDGKVVVL